MRLLFSVFVLSFCTSLFAQEPKLHPIQVGLFGFGANSFMMSDPANAGGQWVSQSTAQSALNYWALSGSDVYRASGNATIVVPTHSTFTGWQLGLTQTDIYASDKMNLLTGEYRHVAGQSGYGGIHTWHTNGVERMRINAAGDVNITNQLQVGTLFLNGAITSNIEVTGKIFGGFGAATTNGTLDWNHSSNARAGNGYTLLLGSATNGMGTGEYFHPFGFEYGNTGNMTQFAVPYLLNGGSSLHMRTRFGGSWSSWSKLLCENVSGRVLIGTTMDVPAYKVQVAGGSVYSEGAAGVAYWTDPGQAISSTSGAVSLRTPSITGGAVTIAPRTLNDALVVNTDGRTTMGTTTNNGVDRLQVNGSVRFTGVTKLDNSLNFTNATLGSITNGTATFSIFSKGAVSLPTTFSTSPVGVADGELWTDLSTSSDHKLRFRQNGVSATISTRERDFAGGGSWAALASSSQQLDVNRNARVDANTNAIVLEADLDMIEGLAYRRFIQRSTTNAVTVSVSGMSGNMYYTGCSSVGGCTTLTLANNTNYEFVRIGTTLWVTLL